MSNKKYKYGACLLGKGYHTNSQHIYEIYRLLIELFNSDEEELYAFPVDLNQLTAGLNDFATERHISSDNELLRKVKRVFDNAIATWRFDAHDFANIKEILSEAIKPLNRLDETTDRTEPKQPAAPKGIKIPSQIELKIISIRETRDMSVGNRQEEKMFINLDDLKQGMLIQPPGCASRLRVDEVTDKRIALSWGRDVYALNLGDVATTEQYSQDNDYLSLDSIMLKLEYRVIPNYYFAMDLAAEIVKIHERCDSSVIPETSEAEQKVLALLDLAIKDGTVGAWTAKALFAASNNWATCVIVRNSLFKSILLEGIGNGALAPDDDTGWGWIDVATNKNDPATFMDDMTRYYDLLATAAENGVEIALDIINEIWEPENIIEED